MEIVGLIFQAVQCMSPSIARRWDNHRNVFENMETLRKNYQELNGRKGDIESRLVIDLVEGETELKGEVKNWLECVEKIGLEVDGIEAKVRVVKFFSRAGLGKIVNLKITEVVEIHRKGVFMDGLVVQLPRRGYVKPTTSILGGETTFQRKTEEIWSCLLDNEVVKTGVYGMGGIGKTTAIEHIHNRLLKDRKDDFRAVIWVTVSKDCSIITLQEKIASKLELDLSNVEDVETRAERLYGLLHRKMRFALILDDLWEDYSLKEIGIPEPTSENGCKLVVTTRSMKVCHGMGCNQLIEMECLSENEALSLFVKLVGSNALNVSNLKAIINDVARECAGLPLAIVVVAGSLKGVVDINEWEIALAEFRDHSKADSTYDRIFERLKFSYDRLNGKRVQDCLLYCALFPEDERIEREMLIEHLIAEGIVEERKTRQSQIRDGHVMLNKLVNACLLKDTDNYRAEKCIMMHDLVRDMALKITSESPRYLVRAGVGLRFVPDEGDWGNDVVKVSLMGNERLTSIPSEHEPKKCFRLSTLLLQRNFQLCEISNNFFLHMRMLSVLDLSETGINHLPPSISDLTALTAMFLRYCRQLINVPSLAKLTNLKLLDLNSCQIEEVPHGLEMLTKLRYLDLFCSKLKSMPSEILRNLVDLQFLSLYRQPQSPRVRFEDLEKLSKLETIEAILYDLDNWNAFVRSWESRRLVSYVLQLGPPPSFGLSDNQTDKVVYLQNLSIGDYPTSSQCPLLLPGDVEILTISYCTLNIDSLCELGSSSRLTKLRECTILVDNKMKHVFSLSSPAMFQSLETLFVANLTNFDGLIRRNGGGGSPSPLPHGTFSSLKCLSISHCHKMSKLDLISLLPNLEELTLQSCQMLREILCDDKGGLPKLKTLILEWLHSLVSVPLMADSLRQICIEGCEKLRKLPIIDREPFPSTFERAIIHPDTWSGLEWNHPNAKNSVQSVLKSRLSINDL